MLRRLLNLLSAFSLLLCGGAVALWWVGHLHLGVYPSGWSHQWHGRIRVYRVWVTPDSLSLDTSKPASPGVTLPPATMARVRVDWIRRWVGGYATHRVVDRFKGDQAYADPTGGSMQYGMSLALPFLVGLPLSFWSLVRTRGAWVRRRAARKGHCAACGYDLRATPGRCPECGAVSGD